MAKFKGWDYSELAKAWRISTKDQGKMVEEMKAKINALTDDVAHDSKSLRQTKVYKDCRAFLKALIRDCEKSDRHFNDYAEYWRGIQRARDPHIFLQFIIWNLERMWN